MGYRTVLSLNNDCNWSNLNDLGKIIQHKAANLHRDDVLYPGLGIEVLEVVHADTATLSLTTHYGSYKALAHTHVDTKNIDFSILEAAADSLGYKLVKK